LALGEIFKSVIGEDMMLLTATEFLPDLSALRA
jgi:hypothetical protein